MHNYKEMMSSILHKRVNSSSWNESHRLPLGWFWKPPTRLMSECLRRIIQKLFWGECSSSSVYVYYRFLKSGNVCSVHSSDLLHIPVGHESVQKVLEDRVVNLVGASRCWVNSHQLREFFRSKQHLYALLLITSDRMLNGRSFCSERRLSEWTWTEMRLFDWELHQ